MNDVQNRTLAQYQATTDQVGIARNLASQCSGWIDPGLQDRVVGAGDDRVRIIDRAIVGV